MISTIIGLRSCPIKPCDSMLTQLEFIPPFTKQVVYGWGRCDARLRG